MTDVSGRGVGMDVVKNNIEKLGGKIEVDSAVGEGTSIRIRLPLTLAIVPSLIVAVEQERFAVPQVNLVEIVRVKAGDTQNRFERVKGADVLRLRGRLLPLVRLADVLQIPRTYADSEGGAGKRDRRQSLADRRGEEETPEGVDANRAGGESERRRSDANRPLHVVVLRTGGHRYGLVVDAIADSEEIVVKPLSQFLKGCRSYAGATIMGDGRVATILDVAGLASESNLNFAEATEEETDRRDLGGEQRELILFANAHDEQFAVELDEIVRLEKIERSNIETIGGAEYIQHLGKGLPLVRLETRLPVSPIDPETEELYVLIPRMDEYQVGILASRVIDTVETTVTLDRTSQDAGAINGRAVVQGNLTTFIDTKRLVEGASQGAIA